MTMNFNVEPYYDDFDENKNFQKILFRPGYAVQTRELNQLQSILQNQTNDIGKHLFKNGSVVDRGNITFEPRMAFVKIQNYNSSSNPVKSYIPALKMLTLTGQTSGAKAVVIHTEVTDGIDPHLLYIRYTSSGDSSVYFSANEILVDENNEYSITVLGTDPIGFGSIVTITEGIYYINDYFVKIQSDSKLLSKYDNLPNCKVGLLWQESIVNFTEDESLLDNAQGSPNYSAPGADRYIISAVLGVVERDSINPQFIELMDIEYGTATLKQLYTAYNEIETELARRTYKESGDYVDQDFNIELNNHRNDNQGVWVANRQYYVGDKITHTYDSKNYMYECITSGTSGSNAPTYIYNFGTINETGGSAVKWKYIEVFAYNDGLITDGDPSQYVVTLKDGSAFVQGYEYTSNNKVKFVIDKPREFARQNSSTVPVYDGTYVLIKNLYGMPVNLGTFFQTVNLYNSYTATPGSSSGTLVGTAKVRWIEEDSGSTNYRAYIFDVTMISGYVFEDNCKQIQSTGFTADIVPELVPLTGLITASSTSVTGSGTLFSLELKANDYIIADTTTLAAYKVSTPTTNVALAVDVSLTATSSVYYIAKATVYNKIFNSAIFKLPHNVIRNMKSSDDITNDTRYTITRNFGNFTTSGATYSIALTTTGETFASTGNATNYLLVNNTTNLPVAATFATQNSSTGLIISGLTTGASYKLLAVIDKTAIPRIKSLNTTYITFNTEATANAAILSLGKADCYRILSVKQSAAYGIIDISNQATVDISSLFEFNSGQTSLYYGVSSLKRKNEQVKITGSIRIYFEYFTSTSGDYFNVESYTNAISYEEVDYKLRDTIDFRPVMNDAGTNFNQGSYGILKSGNNITADYSYYLGRIDTIVLSSNKQINVFQGESSETPTPLNIPVDGIVLYYLINQPYGSEPTKTVTIITPDNKRYTMRDIGDLATRISKLEDYVSFSLIEENTATLSIKDGDGFDMFKNGFIVESFDGMGVGNLSDIDYRCFINNTLGELYPAQSQNNLSLVEKNTNLSRSGYKVSGDIITLDYEEVSYISNLSASRPININPFSVALFIGKVALTPSSDVWYDNQTLPTIYN